MLRSLFAVDDDHLRGGEVLNAFVKVLIQSLIDFSPLSSRPSLSYSSGVTQQLSLAINGFL